MSRLLVGVSGGIAAYKTLELIRLATAAEHAVRVIQTPTSRRFVGADSFVALTGAPVLSDEFERDPARGAFPDQAQPTHEPISHLELVANADVYLIAPASANTIARLAHGLADNLLCSAALAATCPVAVAPAMNNRMYEHPATRENLERLSARGVTVIAPGRGRLASRDEWGVGRLAEPAELLGACEELARAGSRDHERPRTVGPWEGKRVLVSAGGTREPIDSVRYIGNRSSGRMGYALAEAAADRGAEVTVVSANVALAHDRRVRYVDVQTAAQADEACQALFADSDVLLMAAAIADFRPVREADGKIKKHGRATLELSLQATPDILATLAQRSRPGQIVVGFAAEHGPDALEHARRKLRDKALDALVLNDVSRPGIGFDADENEVVVLSQAGERRIARAPKSEIAQALLDAVAELAAPAHPER